MQAQRLGLNFKKLLNKYGEDEVPVTEMVEKLMTDSDKADKNKLPGICSLDWEYNLSSIFVEVDTPMVNTSICNVFTSTLWAFYSQFLLSDLQGPYGTRSIAALTIRASGEVSFYETYVEKDLWKERTVNYSIQKVK